MEFLMAKIMTSSFLAGFKGLQMTYLFAYKLRIFLFFKKKNSLFLFSIQPNKGERSHFLFYFSHIFLKYQTTHQMYSISYTFLSSHTFSHLSVFSFSCHIQIKNKIYFSFMTTAHQRMYNSEEAYITSSNYRIKIWNRVVVTTRLLLPTTLDDSGSFPRYHIMYQPIIHNFRLDCSS